MLYRDILVHVDTVESMDGPVRCALSVAGPFEAQLTGLYVSHPADFPFYADVSIPQSILDQVAQTELAKQSAAKSRFEELTRGHRPAAEWQQDEGAMSSRVVEHAMRYDLTVVGHPGPDADSDGFLDRLVLEAGRPVLIVPGGERTGPGFDRIILAWNGTREATRALHDALPLLERAKVVGVVSLRTPPREDVPSADIARHLARHGVNVEVDHTREDVVEVGYWLQSHIERYRANLVVMGAYGHSRYREMIFGGVTRHMLRAMTVPCLMSH